MRKPFFETQQHAIEGMVYTWIINLIKSITSYHIFSMFSELYPTSDKTW